MAQMRFKGFERGTTVNLSNVTVGSDSGSLTVAAIGTPATATSLPLVNSTQDDGDTLTLNTSGLTGITAYDWREVGGATLGTSATLNVTTHGGKWVECEVTCNEGAPVSPAVMIYAAGMMASHGVDDSAVVALMPHDDATHIAVADGDWTNTATWLGGRVPANGARVLIPHGHAVTYDNATANIRLDVVRVDGTLTWALDQSTTMLVETLVGTRGSSILMGSDNANRLPAAYTAEIIISGRDYRTSPYEDSDIDITRDTRLWGRGIIAQGTWRLWGNEKMMRSKFDPINAGATSLTMHDDPTGLVVGDVLILGGTDCDYTEGTAPSTNTPTFQDEEVTITSISSKVISWTGGTTHPHKNQLTGSTRTDLYPVAMLKGGRNITIRSEVTSPVWRRGHTVWMHHHCTVDGWDAQGIDLGRTDKSRPAGVIDGTDDTQFRFLDRDNEGFDQRYYGVLLESLTAQSNIQSRYHWHVHHAGFGHAGAKPILKRLYAENSPGWAIVHHACDVEVEGCGVYKFWGAGIVGESGNELGTWRDNTAIHSTAYFGALNRSPKTQEDGGPLRAGDFGFMGYGFLWRGRAMKSTGNIAGSCVWSHVHEHRYNTNLDNVVAPVVDLKREYLDITEAGRMVNSQPPLDWEDMKFVDYPLKHFVGNEAIGCLFGFFVTKQLNKHYHDVSAHLKNFKAWGYRYSGVTVEYVRTYILENFDCVSGDIGASNSAGIVLGANAEQIVLLRCRVEADTGVRWVQQSATQVHDDYDNVNNPRWINLGTDYVGCTTNEYMDEHPGNNVTKPLEDVRLLDDDWDGTALDFGQDPSETFPLEVATWDASSYFGGLETLDTYVGNSDGKKVDNLGSTGDIAPFTSANEYVWATGDKHAKNALDDRGYWQYGGNHVLLQHEIITDRATGRPAKVTKMIRCTATPGSGADNGAYTYAGTACVRADKLAAVATNGSVVIDMLTGATGGGGAGTYALDQLDHIAPDFGEVSFNYGTGEITYTPATGFVGTDSMFAFVHSQGRFATVRIDFLVNDGSSGSLTTPVVDTHFAATGGTGEINIELIARPDTHARRIKLTQYSTDAGVTWRRLCNGWVKAVHTVDVESDGTALGAGAYNVRIRYKTDYDDGVSASSGDDAVTVS